MELCFNNREIAKTAEKVVFHYEKGGWRKSRERREIGGIRFISI
jgi:hypothetical protein